MCISALVMQKKTENVPEVRSSPNPIIALGEVDAEANAALLHAKGQCQRPVADSNLVSSLEKETGKSCVAEHGRKHHQQHNANGSATNGSSCEKAPVSAIFLHQN